MAAELELLEIGRRREWRAWLAKHHKSSPGVWLVFHKAHTGVKSMSYEDTGSRRTVFRVDRQSH